MAFRNYRIPMALLVMIVVLIGGAVWFWDIGRNVEAFDEIEPFVVVDDLSLSQSERSSADDFDQLADGGIVHERLRVFRRLGAIAEVAMERGDPYTFPEQSIRESWHLVDGQGVAIDLVAEMRADDGTLLQLSYVVDGELTVESPSQGVQRKLPLVPGALPSLTRGAEEYYSAAVADGSLVELTSSADSAKGYIRFGQEVRRQSIANQTAAPDAVSIPYVADLPGAVFFRETVLTANFLPVAETTWASLPDGSQELVEQYVWEAFEYIDDGVWEALRSEVLPREIR